MSRDIELEELPAGPEEAKQDLSGVWGYTDARGGLYGWNPDEMFPGYMQMSGCKPILSEEAYLRAAEKGRKADEDGSVRAANRGKTPGRSAKAPRTSGLKNPAPEENTEGGEE